MLLILIILGNGVCTSVEESMESGNEKRSGICVVHALRHPCVPLHGLPSPKIKRPYENWRDKSALRITIAFAWRMPHWHPPVQNNRFILEGILQHWKYGLSKGPSVFFKRCSSKCPLSSLLSSSEMSESHSSVWGTRAGAMLSSSPSLGASRSLLSSKSSRLSWGRRYHHPESATLRIIRRWLWKTPVKDLKAIVYRWHHMRALPRFHPTDPRKSRGRQRGSSMEICS